ncbi:type VI secretion system protein ImpL [Klebsiella michiganensis]|uniref:Type VI secretion system protein ImpL n=1 Tax=Klebsiella michiganensis TaxID=1134687 RepID=A0A7H4PLE7_9ENTR|nr:type VI secretion system protein ImpL [Klebsiella michiganensis]
MFWLLVLIVLVCSLAVVSIVYWLPERLQLIRETSAWYAWLSGTVAASIALAITGVFLFFGARAEGKRSFSKERQNAQGDDVKTPPKKDVTPVSAAVTTRQQILNHLRRRYHLFWRHKVRLLLITGDEAAIEQLVPGLQQQQWLEGNRTVLIYGGSLAPEPDREKYTALRKLRRGRPLDGIVRVMPPSLNLTPQISDSDLRGLEKISELLRYSAPVWLWQLCDSNWSQRTRPEQAVGASFPLRAKEDDIIRQLERMLPALRAQGVSQVAENNSHDFLLRLGQHLQDGGIVRRAQQLLPWLYDSQQRVPLRGLMFSLPENTSASTSGGTADDEQYIPELQRHALTLPATWQGIVDDCTRVRGRRVGMAWERMLAWTLMTIIVVWGAGMLLSFTVNRQQIVSVAEQAHALVAHPSVSDNQLTALHTLRNDAGRLQHNAQEGAPLVSALWP